MRNQLKKIFDQPEQQIEWNIKQMRKYLIEDVVEEIEAFAEVEANAIMEKIDRKLSKRFKNLEYSVYDRIENSNTKEEYQQCLQNFFQLTDVREVAKDLNTALKYDYLQTRYNQAIFHFTQGEYGQFFQNYKFDHSVFNYFSHGVLINMDKLMAELGSYSKQVKKHFDLLKSIKENARGKSFARVGASLAGSFIAGLPGSLAARGIMKAFDKDEEKISASISEVNDSWNRFMKVLQSYLEDLEKQYKHIILSLYGGLFISFQKELQKKWVELEVLNLAKDQYQLRLIPNKRKKVNIWAMTTLQAVNKFINENDLPQAIFTANNFYQYVNQHKVLSRNLVSDGKDVYYYAQLSKVMTHLKQASLIENRDTFISYMEELLKETPVFVDDMDLKKMTIPTQYELVMRYIASCMEMDKRPGYESIYSFIERTYERIGKRQGEEAWIFQEDSDLLYLSISLASYDKIKKDEESNFHKQLRKAPIPPAVAKQIYLDYKQLKGKDKLSRHLLGNWIGSSIGSFLGWMLRPFYKLYSKMSRSRK